MRRTILLRKRTPERIASEASINTTRNIAIECALSEAVLYDPHLKYYQQRFIWSCPFQLLGVGLSAAVYRQELMLTIQSIISSGSRDQLLPII
jgi:hypothetical protein